MSRRVYVLGVALTLVALALTVADRALSSPITAASVQRVRQGMTVQEVEAVLGGPPASWDGNVLQWDGPDGALFVFLDPDVRVVGAEFERWGLGEGHAEPRATGLLARLRAWLGW